MVTRVKGSTIDYEDVTGAVSLQDMGPAGTDISTKLLAALAAGKAIFIPIGTWLFGGATLPVNSVIIGMGAKSVLKVRDTGNSTGFVVNSGCYLKDFVIDGNKVNQVGSGFNGLDLNNSIRSRIDNVTSINAKGSGFVLSGASSENELKDCTATGYTESGFRIVASTNDSIINPHVYSSDAAATGDGIAITSGGNSITGLLVESPKIKSITGRGIALVGLATRNVSDVIISCPRIISTSNHGIFMTLVTGISVQGGFAKMGSADGVRLEGDAQGCRILNFISRGNASYGFREVTNGVAPNFNGFIYCQPGTNGNDVITKVGANSFIV